MVRDDCGNRSTEFVSAELTKEMLPATNDRRWDGGHSHLRPE
jgi:hypothetical protein